MERVIDCPVCFDVDRCFEEIQEDYSSFLCFNCGFMSDSRYEVGSLQLIDNLKKSPKLVQDLKIKDKERDIIWFPSVINMGTRGIIFPEGTPEIWSWRYATVIEIPEEERYKYDNYDRRLDVENAKVYGQYEFLEACQDMGITRDIRNQLGL